MLRDVLTRRDGGTKRTADLPGETKVTGTGVTGTGVTGTGVTGTGVTGTGVTGTGVTETRVTVAAATEPYDEPTWEVRHPDRKRRIDGRTKSILAGAAAAALVVNAGAAWAYWRVMDERTGSTKPGTMVDLQLRGRSDLNVPLTAGRTGNLTVTVTNDHDYPIRITSVSAGTGNVVADDEHRDAGCRDSGVRLARTSFAVSWDVARNTIGAFTIPDGLVMARGTNAACAGAIFTVPVRTNGVSSGR